MKHLTCCILALSVIGITFSHAEPQRDLSKMSQDELKQELTELQFEVTKKDGTEPPFRN